MSSFTPYQKGTAAPAAGVIKFNASPNNRKTPIGNVDKAQKIATAGDIIPLVFCKRDSGIGGVWLEPSLLKAGSRGLNTSLGYAICQGSMGSSPQTHRIFVGLQCLAFLASNQAVTATVNHRFVSAATYASASNTCPYPDDGNTGMLYCGFDNFTFYSPVIAASVNQRSNERMPDRQGRWYNYKDITRGEGDTGNTTYETDGTQFKYFDTESGNDVTAAYWSAFGISPPYPDDELNRRFNPNPPFQVLGGRYVNDVQEGIAAAINPDGSINRDLLVEWNAAAQAFLTGMGIGDEGPTSQSVCKSVDTQRNTSFPASTGTLTGVQYQWFFSTRQDPSNYPSTDDFSSFADITLLQMTTNAFTEYDSGSLPRDIKQLYVYYTDGVQVTKYSAGKSGGVYLTGSSNQFVDLAMHLFAMIKKSSATIPDISSPINVSNLQAIAAYCTNIGAFFNGVLDENFNIIDYLSEVAPYFLLAFLSNGGQYEFQPLLPVTAGNAVDLTAITPAATFTENQILSGSYSKTYTSAEERQDSIINVTYRTIQPDQVNGPVGVEVRYSGTADDAPVISFDMSGFCASKAHASKFAKYELARRRYSTHTIQFETALDTNGLKATDIIEIQRQRINSVGDNRTETGHYQITSIGHTTDGTTSFEAMYFPLNASSIATISNEVINGTFRETAS